MGSLGINILSSNLVVGKYIFLYTNWYKCKPSLTYNIRNIFLTYQLVHPMLIKLYSNELKIDRSSLKIFFPWGIVKMTQFLVLNLTSLITQNSQLTICPSRWDIYCLRTFPLYLKIFTYRKRAFPKSTGCMIHKYIYD